MSDGWEVRDRLTRAQRIVEAAWRDLPADHRRLLESIGAGQHEVVTEELGARASALLRSAGNEGLGPDVIRGLAQAAGLWIHELQLVVINADLPALRGLDEPSYEAMISRIAWHEWGHALSLVRATDEDRSSGERLLKLVPSGIQERILQYDYRRREYTDELVAEIYALLMSRRRRGQVGQPSWLENEIYELVQRVTGWSE